MELTIIGSASAEPNPGGASSCYLLDAGQGQVVLECGHGAAAKLLLHTSWEQVGALLISHMHPDHFFDIVPLKYMITFNGCPRLPLYVPPTGPEVLEGIRQGLDEKPEFWTSAYDVRVFDPEKPLELNGIVIEMSPTHHFIPAWAMRFSSLDGGGVLGYTSDTSLSESVISLVRDADLLLAEASLDAHVKPASKEGHLTPDDAGFLAKKAAVRRLLLTHYVSSKAADIQKAGTVAFGGPCSLAIEGARYSV